MSVVANQDTPHKDRTIASTGPRTAGARSVRKPTLQEFRQRLVQEMTNRSVALSLKDFLEAFLPLPANQKPKRTTATLRKKFSALDDAGIDYWKEDVIADTFTEIVNDHKLAPGLKLVLSQHRFAADDPSKQKVDGAFYPRSSAPTDGKPHWVEQLVPVEFKRGETKYDPFEDNANKAMDPDAESRKNVRSQIIGYAEKIFERRPRTHLFMLIVIGRDFRVLRWDRSGVVVTPRTDYVLHPDDLHEVLWRLGRASFVQLGLDPTATLVKPGTTHYKLMDELSKEVATDLIARNQCIVADGDENNVFAYVREMFRESLAEDWPRWKLSVPQGDGSVRYFLVGKPVFSAPGLVGRATKGYVAVDLLAKEPKKKLVWLKDAWRTFYNFVAAEGVVLKQLKAASVPYIPTLVCHGDLPNQATVTPDIWDTNRKAAEEHEKKAAAGKKQKNAVGRPRAVTPASVVEMTPLALSSSGTKRRRDEEDDKQGLPPPSHAVEGSEVDDSEDKCPLRRHIHYRIVVEEVALALEEFEDGHHLVSIILDCIGAHRQAAKAGILHRDISGGNILIYPAVVDGRENKTVAMNGLLTDWEMSKDINPKARPRRARQPERTGTWQYMSVALINEPTKTVEITDELEAFFHVLLYYAVRYLSSNCKDVPAYMEFYFEAYRIFDGRYRCGSLKTFTITSGELYTSETTRSVIRFGTLIDHVFRTILQWLKAHYAVHEDTYTWMGDNSGAPGGNADCDGSDRQVKKMPFDLSVDADDFVDSPAPEAQKVHTEQTLKDAQKLCQHDYVLALLHWCITMDPRAKLPRDLRWPKTDKVKDQYPDGSPRQLRVVPSGVVGTADDDDSNKRLKTNSGVAVPVRRAPQTPTKSYHSSIGTLDSGFASGSKPIVGSCPP